MNFHKHNSKDLLDKCTQQRRFEIDLKMEELKQSMSVQNEMSKIISTTYPFVVGYCFSQSNHTSSFHTNKSLDMNNRLGFCVTFWEQWLPLRGSS
jgi:hypothetical protein